jgi:hypothetical protein
VSLHRHAAKRDANEGEVVAEWELLGAMPVPMSAKGMPDHAVLQDGRTYWAETKNAKRGLTTAQVDCFTALYHMGVHVYVVRSRQDARSMLAGTLAPWSPTQGKAAGAAKKERTHRPGHSRARALAEICRMEHCPLSRLPGRYVCAKHKDEPDDVVPPRRKP